MKMKQMKMIWNLFMMRIVRMRSGGQSDKSDDMSEVKRMKFTCDDAEVWDRAEEIISTFMMKGSAQLSEQHGLLKSIVLFGECCVIKVYECAWFKIS
jgi:hypothetical protein